MKGFFTALVILLLISCKESGVQIAKPSTFVHYFNGGFNDQAQDIIKTSDNGYLILANTLTKSTITNSYYKIKLIKTDAFGNQTWEQSYPSFGDVSYAHSYKGSGLAAIRDNTGTDTGYMIVGSAIHTTNTNTSDSLLMIKVEPTKGDVLVKPKTWGIINNSNVQGVAVAWSKSSGRYLVLGQTSNTNASMLLAEVKDTTISVPTLDTTWTKRFGDGQSILTNRLFIDPITETKAYWGGTVKYPNTGSLGRYVRAPFNSQSTDFNIGIGSSLSYNVTGTDMCLSGYGYAFVGGQSQAGATQFNKISYSNLSPDPSNGGLIIDSINFYLKSFTGIAAQTAQPANSICSTQDGGLLILGTVAVDAQGTDTDYYLIKIDGIVGHKKPQWTKQQGSKFIDVGCKVLQASDGGYIILGTTNLANVNSVLLMKTDGQGNIQ